MPPECDVSIRPGWFWHEKENAKVKTPRDLMDLYYKSVGRGASFLLNVPPDRGGVLYSTDVASLKQFGELVANTFANNLAAGAKLTASNVRAGSSAYGPQNLVDGRWDTYWATDDSIQNPELTVEFARAVSFNIIRLREDIRLGQRIGAFAIDLWKDGAWSALTQGTSIGACRLIRLDSAVDASKLRLRITECPVSPALAEFGLFVEAL
jgi:alpha-L-fucosidase